MIVPSGSAPISVPDLAILNKGPLGRIPHLGVPPFFNKCLLFPPHYSHLSNYLLLGFRGLKNTLFIFLLQLPCDITTVSISIKIELRSKVHSILDKSRMTG